MSNESEVENEDDCPSCGPGVGFRQWKYIMIPVPSIRSTMKGNVDAVMALQPFPVQVCTDCDHVFRNPVREGKNLWDDIDNLLLDLGHFMQKSDPDGELEREFVEGPYY